MNTQPIYLAGPINGRTDADATDWRAAASALLGAPVLDPMARDFRGREGQPGIDAEIVEGDKNDIDRCRAVVLRWDGAGSAGTTMELLYASERGIPVHVWDDRPAVAVTAGRPLSPWVTYHAAGLHPTLEAACAAAARGRVVTRCGCLLQCPLCGAEDECTGRATS